ncbi:MAG: hypoxanthine phosphoribosyltransferase [Candidatus Latescibacteria bacterium]|jgi:hypoxanthine phosphoribosyltransferase|nr:hypoxanthine phosphoribosyltransferase [Candidatus Latescibacterota bacterium]
MQTLISADQIAEKINVIGEQISHDYEGTDLLLICVLKGSFIFTADLMRAITIPHTVEFLKASSYGSSTVSSGEVDIQDFTLNVSDRAVLVVEDIVDTGLTLQYIMKHLSNQKPASLRLCSLLDKSASRQVDIPLDYCGFSIPDAFVVGYGLDVDEKYRHLPFIGIVD